MIGKYDHAIGGLEFIVQIGNALLQRTTDDNFCNVRVVETYVRSGPVEQFGNL